MNSILRKIYLYRIFNDFMLIYPLYSVMFAERGHLDTFTISTLLIIWSVTGLIFEVPSGALADKFSRRGLLAIGQIIRAAGYVLWVVWPTYTGFAIGLILWGLGSSFDSGTFEALLFDELAAAGKEKKYTKAIGRSESIAMFVGIGATLLASPVLKQFGYAGVVWVSAAAAIIAGAIAMSLPKKARQKQVETPSYIGILRAGLGEVAHSPLLLQLIVFGVILGTLFGVMDEYASLFLKAAHVTNYWIPIVSAAMFLPSILIGFAAHRFDKWRAATFMLLLIVGGVALAGAGQFIGPWGIICFAAFLLIIKLSMIVYNAKLQYNISGSSRSTITSINYFGLELASICAYALYGGLTRHHGTAGALEYFGLATVIIGVLLLVTSRGHLLFKTARRQAA